MSVEDDDVADGDVDIIVPRGCPEVDATGACAELAVFDQKIVQRDSLGVQTGHWIATGQFGNIAKT